MNFQYPNIKQKIIKGVRRKKRLFRKDTQYKDWTMM